MYISGFGFPDGQSTDRVALEIQIRHSLKRDRFLSQVREYPALHDTKQRLTCHHPDAHRGSAAASDVYARICRPHFISIIWTWGIDRTP